MGQRSPAHCTSKPAVTRRQCPCPGSLRDEPRFPPGLLDHQRCLHAVAPQGRGHPIDLTRPPLVVTGPHAGHRAAPPAAVPSTAHGSAAVSRCSAPPVAGAPRSQHLQCSVQCRVLRRRPFSHSSPRRQQWRDHRSEHRSHHHHPHPSRFALIACFPPAQHAQQRRAHWGPGFWPVPRCYRGRGKRRRNSAVPVHHSNMHCCGSRRGRGFIIQPHC